MNRYLVVSGAVVCLLSCKGGIKSEPCENALREVLPVVESYLKQVQHRLSIAQRAGDPTQSIAGRIELTELAQARWLMTAVWNAYTWERLEDMTRNPNADEDAVRAARIATQALTNAAPSDQSLKIAAKKLSQHCQ